MVDLIPVDHDPFAPPQLVPVDHDPWADVPTAQEFLLSPAGHEMGMALAAKARGDISEAQNALWGMTGIPDIQQGAQALGRGEYLPAMGQMAAGAAQFGSLAGPVARGAATLGREALGAVPGVMGDTAGTLRLFHGSPHDFEAFDSSKIGTGEGAQAYGHGLYFAEHEPVAKGYRDAGIRNQNPDYSFSDNSATLPAWAGNQIAQYPPGHEYYNSVIDGLVNNFKNRMSEQDNQWALQPWVAEANKKGMQRIIDSLDRLKAGEISLNPRPTGRMYEAQINADPEHFLDWDKPFNEQSPQVKAAINGLADSNPGLRDMQGPEGSDYYRSIAQRLGGLRRMRLAGSNSPASLSHDEVLASQALRDAGIPGIRYLDQGSRGAGEGTHNYVVFDDKLIDIIKKYGLAGLIAGGAATVGGSPAGATHVIPVDHDPFAGVQP